MRLCLSVLITGELVSPRGEKPKRGARARIRAGWFENVLTVDTIGPGDPDGGTEIA